MSNQPIGQYWFDTTTLFAILVSYVRGRSFRCAFAGVEEGGNMRTRTVVMAVAFAVCSATAAHALDRGARVIGQAGVDFTSYKDMSAARVIVWDETSLSFEREWAVVAGLGAGEFFRSGMEDNPAMLFAALGAKWYPQPTTSVQLLGTCEWLVSGSGFRAIGGTAVVEQRFITQQSALSPFLTISASLQRTQANPWGVDEESFTSLVIKAGAGCDLIMSEDVTLVVLAAFTDSEASAHIANRGYADGWSGSVALKYYWF